MSDWQEINQHQFPCRTDSWTFIKQKRQVFAGSSFSNGFIGFELLYGHNKQFRDLTFGSND